MINRRHFLALCTLAVPHLLHGSPTRFAALPSRIKTLEETIGGRLGVSVLDTATGERAAYRGDERFAMCSTFKFLLATATLARVDRHEESLTHTLAIPPLLVPHSPLTAAHVGSTMSVADLCHAAVVESDNTAANVLLGPLGGPAGFTAFARSIGDPVTRLDRLEPIMNESLVGDPRDTTSPVAMVANLQSVLLGNVLTSDSRLLLTGWMEACETGLTRLRAHLPQGWHAADKTGSNGEHTTNDIAVFWPTNRPPVLIAAYLTQCHGPESKRSDAVAQIAQWTREALG
jgi:beta-lactamase class A